MLASRHPVHWFEIPTTDIGRARRFYEAVFDIELDLQELGGLKMAWFPMGEGEAGSTGTLIQSEHYTPSHQGALLYFEVRDVDAALERVVESGGSAIRGKEAIGEYGWVGHFEDTEGNRIGLHAH